MNKPYKEERRWKLAPFLLCKFVCINIHTNRQTSSDALILDPVNPGTKKLNNTTYNCKQGRN
jgi:hypothetical protein